MRVEHLAPFRRLPPEGWAIRAKALWIGDIWPVDGTGGTRSCEDPPDSISDHDLRGKHRMNSSVKHRVKRPAILAISIAFVVTVLAVLGTASSASAAAPPTFSTYTDVVLYEGFTVDTDITFGGGDGVNYSFDAT